MSLFENLVSGMMKTVVQEVESRALPALLSQVLARTDLGSVGGLLAQLKERGLDRQVASWLGTGSNMPLGAGDLQSALGPDHLRQIAEALGLPLDGVIDMLQQRLPDAIDQMSPRGELEEPTPPSADPGGSLADQAGLRDIRRR